jgi:hypothetical protein
MQPGSPETLMTPREAAFISTALPSDHFLKERLDTAIMDWTLSVSSPEFIEKWQDTKRGKAILRSHALATAGREAGEDLSVSLNNMELTIVLLAAVATVENATEDASSINHLYGEVVEDIFPGERLSDDNAETFKSNKFQDKPEAIQMGNRIISSIAVYLKSR